MPIVISFSVCLHLSLPVYVCASVRLCVTASSSVSDFLCRSISFFSCLSVCLSLCLPVCVSLPTCLSVSSFCASVRPSVCLSVCLSVSLSPLPLSSLPLPTETRQGYADGRESIPLVQSVIQVSSIILYGVKFYAACFLGMDLFGLLTMQQ